MSSPFIQTARTLSVLKLLSTTVNLSINATTCATWKSSSWHIRHVLSDMTYSETWPQPNNWFVRFYIHSSVAKPGLRNLWTCYLCFAHRTCMKQQWSNTPSTERTVKMLCPNFWNCNEGHWSRTSIFSVGNLRANPQLLSNLRYDLTRPCFVSLSRTVWYVVLAIFLVTIMALLAMTRYRILSPWQRMTNAFT